MPAPRVRRSDGTEATMAPAGTAGKTDYTEER
jgi:hypothetical protein